jgi:hypothetical protein
METAWIWSSADDRWRDDVWTMKYLSGFKWEMLGEQVGMSTFQISSCALSHIFTYFHNGGERS